MGRWEIASWTVYRVQAHPRSTVSRLCTPKLNPWLTWVQHFIRFFSRIVSHPSFFSQVGRFLWKFWTALIHQRSGYHWVVLLLRESGDCGLNFGDTWIYIDTIPRLPLGVESYGFASFYAVPGTSFLPTSVSLLSLCGAFWRSVRGIKVSSGCPDASKLVEYSTESVTSCLPFLWSRRKQGLEGLGIWRSRVETVENAMMPWAGRQAVVPNGPDMGFFLDFPGFGVASCQVENQHRSGFLLW